MCGPCYLYWDGINLDRTREGPSVLERVREIVDSSTESNTTSIPVSREQFIDKMRRLFPLELRIALGEDLAYWGRIVEAVEKERKPVEDYNLNEYDLQSFFNSDALTNDEKVDVWSDMTLHKMNQMNDGEFLAYYNVIYDALNVI